MAMKVIKRTVKANKPAKTVKKQELEDEDEVLDEEDEVEDDADEEEEAVEDEVEDEEDEVEDEEDDADEEDEEAPAKKTVKKAPAKKTVAKKSSKEEKKAPAKKTVAKKSSKEEKKAPAKKTKAPKIVIEGNALTVDDKADNLKTLLESMNLASVAETVTKADADRIFKAVESIQVAAINEGKTFKIGGITNGFSVNRKNVAARVYAAVDSIPGMDSSTLITAHTEMVMKAFVGDKNKFTYKGKKVKDGVFKTTDGETVKY